MKKYTVHFRHRDNGTLQDVFEQCDGGSLTAVRSWAKRVAEERGWWLVGVERS